MAQTEEAKTTRPALASLGLASRAVHGDDGISAHRAVAPALHVSTTYAYDRDPARLVPNENVDVSLVRRRRAAPPRAAPHCAAHRC